MTTARYFALSSKTLIKQIWALSLIVKVCWCLFISLTVAKYVLLNFSYKFMLKLMLIVFQKLLSYVFVSYRHLNAPSPLSLYSWLDYNRLSWLSPFCQLLFPLFLDIGLILCLFFWLLSSTAICNLCYQMPFR